MVDVVDGVAAVVPELPVDKVLEVDELLLIREAGVARVENLDEAPDGVNADVGKNEEQVFVVAVEGGYKNGGKI